jgi:hypothetical protein
MILGFILGLLALPAAFLALFLFTLYRYWRRESGTLAEAAAFEKAFNPKDRG